MSPTETVRWSDREDEVIAGDLTAALAYVTPAGGAVSRRRADRAARPRCGHCDVHDLARVRAQARPHRPRPARGARLPRPRARLRKRARVRARSGHRQLSTPPRPACSPRWSPRRPRASWARRRPAPSGTAGGAYYADRVLVTVAGDAGHLLAGPRVRRDAAGHRRRHRRPATRRPGAAAARAPGRGSTSRAPPRRAAPPHIAARLRRRGRPPGGRPGGDRGGRARGLTPDRAAARRAAGAPDCSAIATSRS